MEPEASNDEAVKNNSKIVVLEGGARQMDLGWPYSTEDIVALVSGLSDLPTVGGGFLGIGAFHNLDIALDRKADSIVLMDIDREIVDLNLHILQIVEKTDKFEDLLPNIRKFIQEQDVMPSMEFFDKYISVGTNLRCRTPLSWAKNPESFEKLKQLINDGKVAVAHSDITDPTTMKVIEGFFTRSGVQLQYVNLSNVENPGPDIDNQEFRSLGNISKSLQEAGGTPTTIVVSSVSSEKSIPVSHQARTNVLKPKVKPVRKSKSMFSLNFIYFIRSLDNLNQDGPLNLSKKNQVEKL